MSVLNFSEWHEKQLKEAAVSYDEPSEKPRAGIRAEDYEAKERLRNISICAEELFNMMEDGQELEGDQQETIDLIYQKINQLKRQYLDQERVRAEDIAKKYSDLNNPNL